MGIGARTVKGPRSRPDETVRQYGQRPDDAKGAMYLGMKTLSMFAAFTICSTLTGFAENKLGSSDTAKGNSVDAQAPRGKLATRDQDGKFHTQDGILRAQGSMHFMKGGKLTRIDSETKLTEGFTVNPDGSVKKPDGSTIKLEEGQMLTLTGKLTAAPATTGTTAPGTLPSGSAANSKHNAQQR
jgi:hypothetical protein